MEGRGPQEIHLYVVWRQVIAGGQPGLVELHGSVGGGEQPTTKPDFHMSNDWGDVDRVAWRHDATCYRWVAEDCSSPDFSIVEDRTDHSSRFLLLVMLSRRTGQLRHLWAPAGIARGELMGVSCEETTR